MLQVPFRPSASLSITPAPKEFLSLPSGSILIKCISFYLSELLFVALDMLINSAFLPENPKLSGIFSVLFSLDLSVSSA